MKPWWFSPFLNISCVKFILQQVLFSCNKPVSFAAVKLRAAQVGSGVNVIEGRQNHRSCEAVVGRLAWSGARWCKIPSTHGWTSVVNILGLGHLFFLTGGKGIRVTLKWWQVLSLTVGLSRHSASHPLISSLTQLPISCSCPKMLWSVQMPFVVPCGLLVREA